MSDEALSPVEAAAAELLTALDKMHARSPLSLNANAAREKLRAALALKTAADAERARFAA